MYTNYGLVAYAKEWLKLNTRYGWGCWGQLINANIIQQKAKQYPDHYDAKRQYSLKQLISKAWLIDCVGLIKGYYWGQVPGGLVRYVASTDISADDMYYKARIKGKMPTMPDIPGICVQMSGHIGIYIGDGQVIESTRGVFGDGVVQTKLSDRKWVHWLECPYITYERGGSVLEKSGDKPSEWAKESTDWAKENGIFNGDGEGNYDWQKPLTREALAVVLKNYNEKFGG